MIKEKFPLIRFADNDGFIIDGIGQFIIVDNYFFYENFWLNKFVSSRSIY